MEEKTVHSDIVENLREEIIKISEERRRLIDKLAMLYLPEEVRNFTTGVRILMLKEKANSCGSDSFEIRDTLKTIETLGKVIRNLLDIEKQINDLLEEN